MARFDVFRLKGSRYVLDCQADVLTHFKTRFVVPLHPARGAVAATRLHPIFEVDGKDMIMVTHLAAALPVAEIGPKVTSLADQQLRVISALDMLLTGY